MIILYISVLLASFLGYLSREKWMDKPFSFVTAIHVAIYATMAVSVLMFVGTDFLSFLRERKSASK